MNYPSSMVKKVCSHFSMAKKSRGAVLILAILIVALVAGLGIKFAGDYQLGLARAEGRWHGAQGRAYINGAEAAAIFMLKTDNTPDYDSLDEQWAQEIPIPLEGGNITLHMTDANSQIDLNSLIRPFPSQSQDPRNPDRYSSAQRMFIRLLQTFPDLVHSESEATDILEALVDWTDFDSDTSGNGGAEDGYYSGLVDPYLPANNPFRSVEELQLVRGITPELMKALRPYITVLPNSALGAVPNNGANASQNANSSVAKNNTSNTKNAEKNSNKNGVKSTTNQASRSQAGNSENNNGVNGAQTDINQPLNINTLEVRLLRAINRKDSLLPLSEQQADILFKAMPESGHYSNRGEFDAALARVGPIADFDIDNIIVKTDVLWLTAQAQIGDQRRTVRTLLQRTAGSPFSVVRREDVY